MHIVILLVIEVSATFTWYQHLKVKTVGNSFKNNKIKTNNISVEYYRF